MAEKEDILLPHNYDGVEEFDNPLPGWWKHLFLGTILFSALYMFYYHAGVEGRRIQDEYDSAISDNLRVQFAEIGELKPDRATIVKYMDDPTWIKVGESVYKSNCVSCHGTEGQGLVGPNLCDDSYKNVTQLEDIAKIVVEGAAGQAMPAWKTRLHPNEVVLVASYVANLRGKPLAVPGKEPYGQTIPPWDKSVPSVPAADTDNNAATSKPTTPGS